MPAAWRRAGAAGVQVSLLASHSAAGGSLTPPLACAFFFPLLAGYVLGPLLGKGGFCSVRRALHELTGRAVACKIIEKGKLKVGGGPGAGWLAGWLF